MFFLHLWQGILFLTTSFLHRAPVFTPDLLLFQSFFASLLSAWCVPSYSFALIFAHWSPFQRQWPTLRNDMSPLYAQQLSRTRCCLRSSHRLLSPVNISCRLRYTAGRRHGTMPPTSHTAPVGTVDEIKERSGPVFSLSEFRQIAWVRVFGSFSQGKQSPESDVDLLVGMKEGDQLQ
jgi:hypothetical protein